MQLVGNEDSPNKGSAAVISIGRYAMVIPLRLVRIAIQLTNEEGWICRPWCKSGHFGLSGVVGDRELLVSAVMPAICVVHAVTGASSVQEKWAARNKTRWVSHSGTNGVTPCPVILVRSFVRGCSV